MDVIAQGQSKSMIISMQASIHKGQQQTTKKLFSHYLLSLRDAPLTLLCLITMISQETDVDAKDFCTIKNECFP